MIMSFDWLDRVIAEQAAYYNTTPERMAKAMDDLCKVQEMIERTGIANHGVINRTCRTASGSTAEEGWKEENQKDR